MYKILLPISFATFVSLTIEAAPLLVPESSRDVSPSEVTIFTWPLKLLDLQAIPMEARQFCKIDDKGAVIFNLTQDQYSKYSSLIEPYRSYPNVQVNIDGLPDEGLVTLLDVSFNSSTEEQKKSLLETALTSETSVGEQNPDNSRVQHFVPFDSYNSDTNPLAGETSVEEQRINSPRIYFVPLFKQTSDTNPLKSNRSLTAEDTIAFMRENLYTPPTIK